MRERECTANSTTTSGTMTATRCSALRCTRRLAGAVQRRGGRRPGRASPNSATSNRTTKRRVGVHREEVKLSERQGFMSLALIPIRINDFPFPPCLRGFVPLLLVGRAVSRVHLAVDGLLVCGCHVIAVRRCAGSWSEQKVEVATRLEFAPFGLPFRRSASRSQPIVRITRRQLHTPHQSHHFTHSSE